MENVRAGSTANSVRHAGRILVIRGGAIGDFILTLPVLSALRAQFPTAQIEVLGYRHIAELARAGGLADAVRSIEARPLAGYFAQSGTLDPELQEYFASFAIILSFLYDPEDVFATNVRRSARGQFIAGPHRPDDRNPVHATEVFLKPLERLAIFDADPMPRLVLPSRDMAAEPNPPAATRLLALHPGSGSERKNWPETNWAKLLECLSASTSSRLLLVGGEAEGDRLQRLAARAAPGRLECAFHLPLPELAARLSACSLLVGHDSGISHLAAALGIGVLALWADTPEDVWRPRGPSVRILRSPEGLAQLEVEEVLKWVTLAAPEWV